MGPNWRREILTRNAVYRAWAETGLPLVGGWEITDSNLLYLRLGCTRCGKKRLTGPLLPEKISIDAPQRKMVGSLAEFDHCYHLGALLFESPAEVKALVPLLLLENPGVVWAEP